MCDPMTAGEGDAGGRGTSVRRWSFILSVWAEPFRETNGDAPLRWRGYLETPARERSYFDTLGDLNRLLTEATGWRDGLNG